MSTNTNRPSGAGIGRWLRVGFFTFTVLGPAINTVLERTALERERRRARSEAAEDQVVVVTPGQEAPIKPSLSESLLELPYTQALVKRGEVLASDLRERGNRLSQNVTEHGSKVTHDLVDRSSELTRDLIGRGGYASQEMLKQSEWAVKELRKQSEKAAKTMRKQSEKAARRLTKQSRKASKELTRRSEKISQELVKRSQEFTQDLVERNGRAWAILGFGIGLVSASAVVYVLLTKRGRQHQEEEADQHILLSPNGYKNPSLAEQNGSSVQTEPITIRPSQSETTTENIEQSAPTDAALVGVVSTRRYYPVETPLDQLHQQASTQDKPADLIYFGSEEEAKAQGFSPAD